MDDHVIFETRADIRYTMNRLKIREWEPTPAPGGFTVNIGRELGVDAPVILRQSDLDTLNRHVAAEAPETSRSVLAALHSQQAEVTTSAPPSRGEEQAGRAALAFVTEHRDRVEAAVAALKDPAARAKADQLLQTIREEAAAREQISSRGQEVELER